MYLYKKFSDIIYIAAYLYKTVFMRVPIVDLYKILYNKTRAKWPSIIGAVAYISLLNVITIRGLAVLMETWVPAVKVIKTIFRFPYVLLPALVILSLNYMIITPIKNLKKERQKKPYALPIIVYTFACVVLVLYELYGAKIM